MATNKMLNKINLFPENKKGDKMISIYWFAILIIVAGGIFGMVYVFYGTPYDIREIESQLLINKIADCISYAGKINPDIVSSGNFNKDFSLSDCKIIFSSTEWEDEQYYSEVEFYDISNLDIPLFKTILGNTNLLTSCNLQENKEYSNLAQCKENSFYSVDDTNNQYIIKILTSVRKAEKNVKL